MKKFFLLAAVAGLTATPALAVVNNAATRFETSSDFTTTKTVNNTAKEDFTTVKAVNTWTAADVSTLNANQTKALTATQLKTLDSSALQAVKVSDLDTATVKQLDTATIKTLTPVQRADLLKLQLADDSIEKVTVDRDAVLAQQVNKDLIAVKKIPCVEFDDDVVEAVDFKVKYELDDNGLKTVDLTEAEFKPFVSVKKYPQLYKIQDWDPETEVINPLTNRAEYCTKYSNKCKLDTTLVKNYISAKKIRKLKLCDNVKVLPVIDLKCVGVKCGEGQECSGGCCKYQEKTTADITLKPILRDRYEISDLELVAKPVALQDETAKLFLEDPEVEEEMLNTKVLMEKATNASQAELLAVKAKAVAVK